MNDEERKTLGHEVAFLERASKKVVLRNQWGAVLSDAASEKVWDCRVRRAADDRFERIGLAIEVAASLVEQGNDIPAAAMLIDNVFIDIHELGCRDLLQYGEAMIVRFLIHRTAAFGKNRQTGDIDAAIECFRVIDCVTGAARARTEAMRALAGDIEEAIASLKEAPPATDDVSGARRIDDIGSLRAALQSRVDDLEITVSLPQQRGDDALAKFFEEAERRIADGRDFANVLDENGLDESSDGGCRAALMALTHAYRAVPMYMMAASLRRCEHAIRERVAKDPTGCTDALATEADRRLDMARTMIGDWLADEHVDVMNAGYIDLTEAEHSLEAARWIEPMRAIAAALQRTIDAITDRTSADPDASCLDLIGEADRYYDAGWRMFGEWSSANRNADDSACCAEMRKAHGDWEHMRNHYLVPLVDPMKDDEET